MASEKQIAANRRNSRRSTGPRTQGGKARSRMNALRHGFSAAGVAENVREDVVANSEFERASDQLNHLYQYRAMLLSGPSQLTDPTDSEKVFQQLLGLMRFESKFYASLRKNMRSV